MRWTAKSESTIPPLSRGATASATPNTYGTGGSTLVSDSGYNIRVGRAALLWKDGWPVAGENLKDGTYEIESVRTGTALELAVEGVPVGGRRARGGPGMFAGQDGVIPA